MKMADRHQSRIVASGHKRVVRGEIKRIRREVHEQYAAALAEAGFFRRLMLRIRIRKEVQARLNKIAPRDGLYGQR